MSTLTIMNCRKQGVRGCAASGIQLWKDKQVYIFRGRATHTCRCGAFVKVDAHKGLIVEAIYLAETDLSWAGVYVMRPWLRGV